MKRTIIILLMILLGTTLQIHAQKKRGSMRSCDVEQFAKQIKKSGILLVDVRTAKEFSEGHIANVDHNIDALKSNFLYRAHRLLPRNRTIALYCKGGVRSKRAAAKLTECGYKVIDLDKGFDSWVEKGMPTTK